MPAATVRVPRVPRPSAVYEDVASAFNLTVPAYDEYPLDRVTGRRLPMGTETVYYTMRVTDQALASDNASDFMQAVEDGLNRELANGLLTVMRTMGGPVVVGKVRINERSATVGDHMHTYEASVNVVKVPTDDNLHVPTDF